MEGFRLYFSILRLAAKSYLSSSYIPLGRRQSTWFLVLYKMHFSTGLETEFFRFGKSSSVLRRNKSG